MVKISRKRTIVIGLVVLVVIFSAVAVETQLFGIWQVNDRVEIQIKPATGYIVDSFQENASVSKIQMGRKDNVDYMIIEKSDS